MAISAVYPANPVAGIRSADLAEAIALGWADFKARPTSAIYLIAIYPLIGLLLFRYAFNEALLPLLFPMASGFALVGPITAVGLYEISRRLGEGAPLDEPRIFRSLSGPVLAPTLQIGALLVLTYGAWLWSARAIYAATLGGYEPATIGEFVSTVLTTGPGWTLIVVGCGVGFVFAAVVLALAAVSLPAVFDRGLGAGEAIALSVKAFVANPKMMLAWGFLVAAGLVIGSLPAFLGLLVVLPVFGHATWHLYRRLYPA